MAQALSSFDLTDAAAAAAKASLLRAAREGVVGAAAEAQVHRALDLLRGATRDTERLRRLGAISCALARLHLYRRQGRINACASTMLRLQRDAQAL
ncbi:MAG: hypothetical protein ACK4K7_07245 [Allosphingosinicella sp.]|uniref:hypothetical protein n=1 Tax=Allosphingosinicella sp. TaxID=2823234 RepID=UPI003959B5DD